MNLFLFCGCAELSAHILHWERGRCLSANLATFHPLAPGRDGILVVLLRPTLSHEGARSICRTQTLSQQLLIIKGQHSELFP